MGTTQAISSKVKYEPNWRGLNTSISSVARAVEELDNIENEIQNDSEQEIDEELNSTIKKIEKRKEKNLKKFFKRFSDLENGSGKPSSGKSTNKVWGRSGKRTSNKLGYVLSSITSSGLYATLDDIGLPHLKGKDLKTVVAGLLDYCATNANTMDEVAARAASGKIIEEFLKKGWDPKNNNITQQAQSLNDKELSGCLINFWGYYIFENLFQRFNEMILHKFKNNPNVRANTAKEIKSYIMNSLNALNFKVDFIKIDWKGIQGKGIIDNLFQSIIKIFKEDK